MTILWVQKRSNALVPDGDESIAEFAKLPFGKSLQCEVKRPRNGPHHRLFWTICTRIANGIGTNEENVSDLLKISTGHYTLVKSKSLGELKLPKSISFAAMEQTDFSVFFERCLVIIFEEWGIDRDAFSDLLDVPGSYGTVKPTPEKAA